MAEPPFRHTERVKNKLLEKHNVTLEEVVECFLNREGPFFRDTEERHDTDPPSWWFSAETDRGRTLKVVFVKYPDRYQLKTAFPPTDRSDKKYKALCAKHAEQLGKAK